jgi:hypothetical protein
MTRVRIAALEAGALIANRAARGGTDHYERDRRDTAPPAAQRRADRS